MFFRTRVVLKHILKEKPVLDEETIEIIHKFGIKLERNNPKLSTERLKELLEERIEIAKRNEELCQLIMKCGKKHANTSM